MKPPRAPRSAVLVIDVQQGLFNADPPPFDNQGVLARINETTAKARAAGVPVIFVQHDGDAAEHLAPFTEGWRLHPGLRIEPGDLIVRKTTGDAFCGTSLDAELRSRHVTSVVLTGYATDFCLDATLRNAVSRDYQVTVVADAHTTNDSPMLGAELIIRHHNWAWQNSSSRRGIDVVPAAQLHFHAAGRVRHA